MKKMISLIMMLVSFCVVLAVSPDSTTNIQSMGAKNGQLYKNDGTIINEADMLDYRTSANTVFGDKIVGIRKNSISSQFVYSLNTDNVTVTTVAGATINTTGSMLHLSTGTATTASAIIYTKQVVRYIPGQESYMFFTCVYDEPTKDNYQRVGLFDDNDGFFVGYEDKKFGITRRRDGTDYFTEITNYNLDWDFVLNPQKGNVYKISFGYLGFATVSFEVLHPSGKWVLLHKIEYPNTSTVTHITNTYLPVRAECANTGNNTDINMYCGSVCAGIVDGGGNDVTSRNFSFSKTYTSQLSGSQPIVAFRNKTTFAGKTNKIPAKLCRVTSSNEANKPILYKLIKSPTTTNTPTWNDVNDNSTMEYSIDGTYNLSGVGETDILTIWAEAKGNDSFFCVGEEELLLYPGETALFFTETTATGFEFNFGIRWRELF